MARPRLTVPAYRRHSKTGRAVVSIYKSDGRRTETLLPGTYGSDESKQAYESILAQLRTGNAKNALRKSPDITCTELVQKFMVEHVEPHYRRADGAPTAERRDFIYTLKPFVRLFGSAAADQFTPLDLQAYRDAILSASWMTAEERIALKKRRGHDGTLCRRTANQRVGRIKHLFKWAASMLLLPASVWHSLQAVSGLQAGRGKARESSPIEPVPLEVVEAVLPYCSQIVGDIIRVQLHTGGRAGEILAMRTIDIQEHESLDIWTFTPQSHKNSWRGHRRQLAVGPRPQLVLRRYLRPHAPEDYIFEPPPARGNNTHHVRYDTQTFDKAISSACKRAGKPHFSSHQLRHLAAQLAECEIGIEAARAYLGQKTVNMTTHYAGINLKAAAEVARRIG